MFDGGVPEQLHHLIATPPPSAPPPPPPPQARTLSFAPSFPSFDAHHHFLHPYLHQQQLIGHKIDENVHKDGGTTGLVDAVGTEGLIVPDHHCRQMDRDHHRHRHPWSSNEVLALLRIRSTIENWLPEITWEHVSRKLTEIGFKRTPQECKDKFEEEESKYFNNHNNNNYNKESNYRMFSELEELYHHGHGNHHHHHHQETPHAHVNVSSEDHQNKNKTMEEPSNQENDKTGQDLEENPREELQQDVGINPSDHHEGNNGEMKNERSPSSSASSSRSNKKRKKRKRGRFEMLKGFCEGFVKQMIAQQEEMHMKLLEDVVRRDEEKVAREEEWKKQEIERVNKELEIRAYEQAIASDRNATIIKFISRFTTLDEDQLVNKVHSTSTTTTNTTTSTTQSSSSLVPPQNPSNSQASKQTNIPTLPMDQNPSSTLNPPALTPSSQTPISFPTQNKPLEPISVPMPKTQTLNHKPSTNDEKDDIGKRWPRDEVLALINIRCSLYNHDHHHHQEHHHNKEGPPSSSSSSSPTTKAPPLWERISQKMLELGYKRSAKRCKEKWENINKYFRKTKDVNKKRSVDSRTCPYFHQLSTLYSQGTLEKPDPGKTGSDL